MRELETVFHGTGEVSGYVFKQVKKSEYAYIYERKFEENGKVICYEVFERKENDRFDCVSYPSSKSFGVWAWCCTSYEKAKKRFDFINEKAKEKEKVVTL